MRLSNRNPEESQIMVSGNQLTRHKSKKWVRAGEQKRKSDEKELENETWWGPLAVAGGGGERVR